MASDHVLPTAPDSFSHYTRLLCESWLRRHFARRRIGCTGANRKDFREGVEFYRGSVQWRREFVHPESTLLKEQSLPGSVPREMVRLPYLQVIDLSRNYLNGTIPPEWGTMEQLVNISLLGNRITGPIPGELANISTLTDLVLEYNQLSGNIPLQFGNFSSIKRILLTSNNLTGELSATLAKLTTLKEFRIGDNNFSGSIPNFIENWTSLEKLLIQGSGLSGPIPSGIASMTKLSDLRISDLNGNDSTFPPLNNTKNLKTLILRSCNIIGQIPLFVGAMTTLKVLDLSFNKLSGPIPENFSGLSNTDFIYLTGNSLTGPLPAWMLKAKESIDLSYNNLTKHIQIVHRVICKITFTFLGIIAGFFSNFHILVTLHHFCQELVQKLKGQYNSGGLRGNYGSE
ncbi:putative leucine-rich repeat receptor-like serine/threonine-protein kinase [Forsythia ovata]|uniref:Leucine-rich repeat receptor-like serine/threonine-protein kinase n=1 Tax=Forsythia ovata TaxID=205694 RepID=A0ABD1NVG3_9LAMI